LCIFTLANLEAFMDSLLAAADTALRTLFAPSRASEHSPARGIDEGQLDPGQRRLAGSLMRVNHVGEVCAQALYTGQAAVTRDPQLRAHLLEAAREETDHLAWTRQRLEALGARPSLLNPFWFAGAFVLGAVAAKVSDQASLGFVAETEDQVAAHLQSHLQRLPAQDLASRAVVARMKEDEERHAAQARTRGALALPAPVRAGMRMAAKVMTTTAHHI
jgi:ubiquinone biosynthesis monooxygenase Coq7